MEATEEAGYNGEYTISLSWKVSDAIPSYDGVSDGMEEPFWKTTFEQPYGGFVGDEFTVDSKLDFYNPIPERPMNGAKFLSYLNLGRIESILQGKYRKIKHFHYPIEAMIKAKIYQRLMRTKARTGLEAKLREKNSLVPLHLGFRTDIEGNYRIPDECTILYFIEKRLMLDGLQLIEDELLRMLSEECLKHGIQLGRKIGVDSTPLEAMPKDEMAQYNGHYELKMWKVHEITCMETHISLGQIVSFGNDFDGDFLIPMLQRLQSLGIKFEEVYGDHHYSTLENWAKVSVVFGAKCRFKIADRDVIRKDGTEQEIKKQYQKFWQEESFIDGANKEYMEPYLVAHGVYKCIGAHYRNEWMKYWEKNPEEAKKKYNERTDVERKHSHLKNAMKLEQNLNVKGLDRVKIYVKEFWIAQMAIALTRLQNGVKEGLSNCGERTFL